MYGCKGPSAIHCTSKIEHRQILVRLCIISYFGLDRKVGSYLGKGAINMHGTMLHLPKNIYCCKAHKIGCVPCHVWTSRQWTMKSMFYKKIPTTCTMKQGCCEWVLCSTKRWYLHLTISDESTIFNLYNVDEKLNEKDLWSHIFCIWLSRQRNTRTKL